MSATTEKRILAAWLCLVAGCTSLAGLDALEPAVPVDGESANDGGNQDTSRAVSRTPEAGAGSSDAESGRDANADAQPDAHDPTCWLKNGCTCITKQDCPGSSFECCNGRCTDTTTDAIHCGTCGNPCPSNQVCEEGQCACGGLFPDQACVANVCIDFMSDPNHCGACTHSCLGGLCLGQACQAVPMAIQQLEPTGIAVDENYVYFANKSGGTIGRLSKDSPTPCAGNRCSLLASPLLNEPVGVATQDGGRRVYITNHAGGGLGNLVAVKKEPWTSEGMSTLTTGQSLWGLAVRGGVVYFTARRDAQSLGKVLEDGSLAPLSRALGPLGADVAALAVDAEHVFFGPRSYPGVDGAGENEVGALLKTSIDNPCESAGTCRSDVVVAGTKARSIAINHQYVFWTSDDDKIRRIAKSCGAEPCVVMVLAEGQTDAQSIVADDSNVYWANAAGGGTIRRTSVFNACRGVGCQSMTPPLGQVFGLTQDAKALYFTTRSSGPPRTGIVWRIAK